MLTSFASVGAASVGPLIDWLLAQGEPRQGVLAVLGYPANEALEPTSRLAVRDVFALWEYAARVVPNGAVSARVASSATLESAHLLGMLAMTAPNAREALRATVAHGALHTDSGAWQMSESAKDVTLCWQRPGSLTVGHRLCNEAAVCHWLNGMRRATAIDLRAERVFFRHEPRGKRELQDFFGCRVEGGAERDGFVLGSAALDAVPVNENRALWRVVLDTAKRELEKLGAASLAERVRAELDRELDRGEEARLSSQVVARRLAMSERSLRRKLDAERTSFRALLEMARRDRTMSLLEDGTHSITEIAMRTGYSEVSAFSHAHRRWFGAAARARRRPQS